MKTKTVYLLMDGMDPVIIYEDKSIANNQANENDLELQEILLVIKPIKK